MNIEKLQEIARAASHIDDLPFSKNLILALLAEVQCARALHDHDYILVDRSVVTVTREYREAREALDAELAND